MVAWARAVAGNLSDAELVELNKKGGIKHAHDSGSAQFTFDKDGSMTQSMEFEVNEDGLNGKVKMKTRMSACPDADGKVTVDIDVDSQMSVSGKPGTGGFVHSTMKYERYLDDDAHLIETADGGAFNHHIKMGGFENFQSQSFEVTTGRERGGKEIYVAQCRERLQHLPDGGSRERHEVDSGCRLFADDRRRVDVAWVGHFDGLAVGRRALHRPEGHQRSIQAQRNSTEHRV